MTTYETKPTESQFVALQAAYDYFNRELFSNELPPALIVIYRKKGVSGYFWQEQFTHIETKQTLDEIGLTPETLDRGDAAVLSTLVHEMVHLWQFHNGKPSRSGYHNKEWAEKMVDVGLEPRSVPGDKPTGQRCTHIVMVDGDFKAACDRYLTDRKVINWFGHAQPTKEVKKNKIAYECDCSFKVWGKPGLAIICEACESHYQEQE